MRNLLVLACLAFPSLGVSALAAQAQEPVDENAVKILREHGLERSQVMDHLSWICDVHGPRLTGSPNLKRAQQWALETFKQWGLANPHLEAWGPFGRGWRLDNFSMKVTGENPWPVLAWPKAWSPNVKGTIEGEVVMVGDLDADSLAALDLRDKIVLLQEPRAITEPFEGQAKRYDEKELIGLTEASSDAGQAGQPGGPGAPGAAGTRPAGGRPRGEGDFRRGAAVLRAVWEKKPLAILDRGAKGDYGTIFVQGVSMPPEPAAAAGAAAAGAAPGATAAEGGRAPAGRNRGPSAWETKDVAIIPQITLAVEHYNRICRMLKKKVPVRIAFELGASFFDEDPMQYNVIAEIPGTDPKLGSEVVMLGAHFDSWHSGTGATDNGCGSAVMMEAMRLLTELVKQTGQTPRRTIRVALWSGEEQGLRGSRGYVNEHFAVPGERGQPPKSLKPEHAKLSGYYNLDNGTGRIRGVYLQGNAAVGPIFAQWLKPFHDLDANTITVRDTGGTDHQAFDGVGLPGFQFIQDTISYSPRTHHSNMDNWDHAIEKDLQQAATIIASFVWHTSQREAMLPREPAPVPSAGPVEASTDRGR